MATTKTSPYAIREAVELRHDGQAAQHREQAELVKQQAREEAMPPKHMLLQHALFLNFLKK